MGFGVTIRTPNQVFEFWGGSYINHCDWWKSILKSIAKYEGAFDEHIHFTFEPPHAAVKLAADFANHEAEVCELLTNPGFKHRWDNWKKAYELLAAEGGHIEIDGVKPGEGSGFDLVSVGDEPELPAKNRRPWWRDTKELWRKTLSRWILRFG